MWYVINISEQGKEKTLLTTRYRNIAQACAAFLPGRNVCRFMEDNWSGGDNQNFNLAEKEEAIA